LLANIGRNGTLDFFGFEQGIAIDRKAHDFKTRRCERVCLRRLRKRRPGGPVMALFWGLAGDNSRYLDGIEATECDIVTTGLKETVQHILTFARRAGAPFHSDYQAAK